MSKDGWTFDKHLGWVAPADYIASRIKEFVERCEVTTNPVGTDTRPIGQPCKCASCLRYEDLRRSKAK